MKLATKRLSDGSFTVVEATTGEEIEGLQWCEVHSGMKRTTNIKLEVIAYGDDGKISLWGASDPANYLDLRTH